MLRDGGPDGSHAKLPVQSRLFGTIVRQNLLDALALITQYRQPPGIAGPLFVRGAVDIALGNRIGHIGGRLSAAGMPGDRHLVAGLDARHFHRMLEALDRIRIALAALLPAFELAQRVLQHIGTRHAQHLLLDIRIVGAGIVVIRPVHGHSARRHR